MLCMYNIPKPIKSCMSVLCTIKLSPYACRLKTLIVNDNKLTCISLHKDEVGSKHQEWNEGEVTCLYMHDHVLCMCT